MKSKQAFANLLHNAREIIKSTLKEKGIKLSHVESADITKAAMQLLVETGKSAAKRKGLTNKSTKST